MSLEDVEKVFEAMAGADLTPAAKLLWVAHTLHTGADGTCSKSWRQLGRMCGLSHQTTVVAAQALNADIGLKFRPVYFLDHSGLKNRPTPRARDIIYKEIINNTRSNERARACAYVTSGETRLCDATPRQAEPSKANPSQEALNAFCAAWPRRTWPSSTGVRSAWQECMDDGVTPAELMRCLELAKLSKAWAEENGRYIPRAAVWLHERRFGVDLSQVRAEQKRAREARERASLDDEIAEILYGIDD